MIYHALFCRPARGGCPKASAVPRLAMVLIYLAAALVVALSYSSVRAQTANYGWAKPTVGASDGTWGDTLNTTTDAIDAQMKANDDAAAKTADNETITGTWVFSGAATFSGGAVVPDSTTGANALNVQTADARYPVRRARINPGSTPSIIDQSGGFSVANDTVNGRIEVTITGLNGGHDDVMAMLSLQAPHAASGFVAVVFTSATSSTLYISGRDETGALVDLTDNGATLGVLIDLFIFDYG